MMERTGYVDIDALLQETWLQVISLRQEVSFAEGEGRAFWKKCVADVEAVRRKLGDAGVSEQNAGHILYTQCALLDECVKGRGVRDDAYFVWCDSPLQAHFFNTLDAGSQLYERIRAVLRDPAPDSGVLVCFHRALMLGFQGGYSSLEVTEREQLVVKLSDLVPAFSFAPSGPALALAPPPSRIGVWLRYWPLRIGLAACIVALLWWGLDYWLTGLLPTLLPEPVP